MTEIRLEDDGACFSRISRNPHFREDALTGGDGQGRPARDIRHGIHVLAVDRSSTNMGLYAEYGVRRGVDKTIRPPK